MEKSFNSINMWRFWSLRQPDLRNIKLKSLFNILVSCRSTIQLANHKLHILHSFYCIQTGGGGSGVLVQQFKGRS